MFKMFKISKAAVLRMSFEEDFAISSVSASFYRSGSATSVWDKAISLPTYATTTGSAIGDKSLAFEASGSSRIPQRNDRFLVADATQPNENPRESITVVSSSATLLSLAESLKSAHASGSRIFPQFVDIALSSADLSALGRGCRVEAELVLSDLGEGENSRTLSAQFDVVRHVPTNTLSIAKLRTREPNTFSTLNGNRKSDDSNLDLILSIAFDEVLFDISRYVRPDLVFSDDQLEPMTLAKLKCILADDGSLMKSETDRLGVIKRMKEDYTFVLNEFLKSIPSIDSNDDGAISSEEAARISVRPKIRLGW